MRACYAALRMQERVKTYAEEVPRSHAAGVKIAVRHQPAGLHVFSDAVDRGQPMARGERYLQWDVTACGVHFVHFRREYVPKTEVERVRRWIRRYRAENALGRALLGLVARYAGSVRAGRSNGDVSSGSR